MIEINAEPIEISKNIWPAKPWLTIWFKPRETIRQIVDFNPMKYFYRLAIKVGISEMINTALEDSWGDDASIF